MFQVRAASFYKNQRTVKKNVCFIIHTTYLIQVFRARPKFQDLSKIIIQTEQGGTRIQPCPDPLDQ